MTLQEAAMFTVTPCGSSSETWATVRSWCTYVFIYSHAFITRASGQAPGHNITFSMCHLHVSVSLVLRWHTYMFKALFLLQVVVSNAMFKFSRYDVLVF